MSDQTIIPKDAMAAVWCPLDGFYILMPHRDDNDNVPEGQAALIACVLRLQRDEAFRQEQIKWMDDQAKIIN